MIVYLGLPESRVAAILPLLLTFRGFWSHLPLLLPDKSNLVEKLTIIMQSLYQNSSSRQYIYKTPITCKDNSASNAEYIHNTAIQLHLIYS